MNCLISILGGVKLINFYSGTPGSGKSLHVAKDILFKLRVKKQNVIANFPVNEDLIYSKSFFGKPLKNFGKFFYVPNNKLNVKYLVDYAKENHVFGKEGQTLLVIDECQVFFNPREFARKDRLEWNNFFSQHRKLGYTCTLVSQNDRLVDRQIRALFEYEVKHRKVNNYKIGTLFPVATFACINYWYGVKEKLGTEFFFYNKKLGDFYDSYKMFSEELA